MSSAVHLAVPAVSAGEQLAAASAGQQVAAASASQPAPVEVMSSAVPLAVRAVENVAEVSTALQPTNIPAVKKRGAKTVLAQDSPELLQFIQQVRQADDEGVDVSNILHALNLKTLANICRHLKCKQGGKKCEYISNITERLMVGGDDDSAASGRIIRLKRSLSLWLGSVANTI